MSDGDADTSPCDPYTQALDAKRLEARISAVVGRTAPVPVQLDDGTVFLRGRRRIDRLPGATDRRSQDRRGPKQ